MIQGPTCGGDQQFTSPKTWRHGKITYEDPSSGFETHFYAHDLRGENQWVQRRYWDEERTQLWNEKQILRVSVG